MTLASAIARLPLPAPRVRTLPVAAVLACLAGTSGAQAQDTTYIGGSGASNGGNVVVNMDALDGGTAPSQPSRGGQQQGDRDYTDEMVEGPSGVLLRFPPQTPPRSHLTVDPGELGSLPQTAQSGGERPTLTPPDGARQSQRTAQPPKPGTPPERQQEPASGTAQVARSEPQTRQEPAADVEPAPERATGQTPGRKPEAPQIAETQAPESPTQATPETPSAPSEPEQLTAENDGGNAQPPEVPETDSAEPEPRAQSGDTQSTETQTAATDPEPEAEPEPEPQQETQAAEQADQPEDTQTARLPDSGLPDQVRLDFASGSSELGAAQREALDALAQRLQKNERQRIQLMAFAAGSEDNASRARRLSLSRALAVRSYLIDQGIRSTRMDVRALGNTADSGPMDRVDIVPAQR